MLDVIDEWNNVQEEPLSHDNERGRWYRYQIMVLMEPSKNYKVNLADS